MSTFDSSIFGLNADWEITLCPWIDWWAESNYTTTVDPDTWFSTYDLDNGTWNGWPTDTTSICVWYGLVDEDWRVLNKAWCETIELHRTLHTWNLHTGSTTWTDLMVSNMDSDQALVSEVSTRHTVSVISATRWTNSWVNSIVSGRDWENTAEGSFITWVRNTNTGWFSTMSGVDNINSWLYGTISGLLNTNTGQAWNIVSGRQNTVFSDSQTNTSKVWNIVAWYANQVGNWGRNLVVWAVNLVGTPAWTWADGATDNLIGGSWNSTDLGRNLITGINNEVHSGLFAGNYWYNIVGWTDNVLEWTRSNHVTWEWNIVRTVQFAWTSLGNSVHWQQNVVTDWNNNLVSWGLNDLNMTFRNIVWGNQITVDNSLQGIWPWWSNGDSILVGQDLTNIGFIQVAVFNEGITAIRSNQTHVWQLFIDTSWAQFWTNARVFATDAAAWAWGLIQWEVYSTPTWDLKVKL